MKEILWMNYVCIQISSSLVLIPNERNKERALLKAKANNKPNLNAIIYILDIVQLTAII